MLDMFWTLMSDSYSFWVWVAICCALPLGIVAVMVGREKHAPVTRQVEPQVWSRAGDEDSNLMVTRPGDRLEDLELDALKDTFAPPLDDKQKETKH